MAIVWGVRCSKPFWGPGPTATPASTFGPGASGLAPPAGNFGQGDPGRYLDIDAVEVEAVYVLGDEVFTHLTGGLAASWTP
jgi:hypothetical protein